MKERRQWCPTWRLPPVSTKGVQNVSVLVTWFIVLERINLRHIWFVTHSLPDYLAQCDLYWCIIGWGFRVEGAGKSALVTLSNLERDKSNGDYGDYDGVTIKVMILNISDVGKCLTWDLVGCLLCNSDSASSWSIYQKFVCWMCSFKPHINTLWKEQNTTSLCGKCLHWVSLWQVLARQLTSGSRRR